jgi:uncharacterized protein with PQ loop repeat
VGASLPLDVIGWASSLVLFLTLVAQLRRQWLARRAEAVSPWLFAGQLIADLGFVVYSALIASPVFVVTNIVLAVTALTGLVMLRLRPRVRAAA